MRQVFADTSYFIALLQKTDAFHGSAVRFSNDYSGRIITTNLGIIELANNFSRTGTRQAVVNLIDSLYEDGAVEIVWITAPDLSQSLRLFQSRIDKEWSLTDCTSFELMRSRSIQDVATTDRHFEQAGFTALLKQKAKGTE